MRDGLTLAKQPFRSGLFVELRNAYGIDCELLSQKFGHEDFRATTGHVSSHLSKIEDSPLLARLEILDRWTATLAKRGIKFCSARERPIRAKRTASGRYVLQMVSALYSSATG